MQPAHLFCLLNRPLGAPACSFLQATLLTATKQSVHLEAQAHNIHTPWLLSGLHWWGRSSLARGTQLIEELCTCPADRHGTIDGFNHAPGSPRMLVVFWSHREVREEWCITAKYQKA
eukprot:1160008-Pelagomonas_calceolata.AAC.7